MISLTYYIGGYHIYSGKVLGLIDKKQFYNLYHSSAAMTRKVGSCAIKTLKDVMDFKDFKGHRLVFSTVDENSVRKILVTAELEDITPVMSGGKVSELTVIDTNFDFFHLEADGNT